MKQLQRHQSELVLKATNIAKIYQEDPFSFGSKKYITALEDISVSIRAGERVGILGENGSGKSTLLKLFAGITQPTSGDLQVYRRAMAVLDLSSGLMPELSGWDNLRLQVKLNAGVFLESAQVDEFVAEAAAFSELENRLDWDVRVYSSGMKMRLVLSSILVQKPKLLVMDEFFLVGDEQFRDKTMRLYDDLKDTTIVFATNNHLSMRLFKPDQVITLLDGQQIDIKAWHGLLRQDKAAAMRLEVTTSSMEPVIPKGSMVECQFTSYYELTVGDVIAYINDTTQDIIIHRIVSSLATDKNTGFICKGDANDYIDAQIVTADDYLCQIVL